MPQNSYKESYNNNNVIDRYNYSNVAPRFNSIPLNHPLPYIDNHQSSQAFYGVSSSYIAQYPAVYGMQKNRRRNYRPNNGYPNNRQYCYDVISGPSALNNTNNKQLKQPRNCNDIPNYYSFERKASIHYAKDQCNITSTSSNNYKRCGNNIVVKVNEYMDSTSMPRAAEDTAITRPPSSMNEYVNNIEQTTVIEVTEVDCQYENVESNYEEVINESTRVNAEEKPEDRIESSSKCFREKTPMCLVNDLARFNKIPFQYRLTNEDGLAHCKVFTVTLKLGDEEYTAVGHKIKKAQHLAAKEAIEKTKYEHPIPKSIRRNGKHGIVRANVIPTVELNALAMKLGQQTCYVLDNNDGYRGPPFSQMPCGVPNQIYAQHNNYGHEQPPCFSSPMETDFMASVNSVNVAPNNTLGSYKMTLYFGEQKFIGFGRTPQQAKRDAAARALPIIKAQANDKVLQERSENQSNGHTKSPISLVFEMALKRNLNVNFTVVSEDGPAHMKKFTTACAVGPYVVEAEGTGKRISKKRAAQKMLDELQKLPPIASVDASSAKQTKRKIRQTNNKSSGGNDAISCITSTEPKSRRKRSTNAKTKEHKEIVNANTLSILTKLKEWCEKHNEEEPMFEVTTEKKENNRRGQCTVTAKCKGITVCGVGKNKGIAKYNAAKNLLNAIGIESPEVNDKQYCCDGENLSRQTSKEYTLPTNIVATTCTNNISKISADQSTDDSKKLGNDTDPETVDTNTGTIKQIELNESEKRNLDNNSIDSGKRDEPQLLNTTAQKCDNQINKECVNHKSSNGLHMKDQLMYLANLLGFEITFSDYPKGNHSESLTIVMLSTNPPQICHGIGITSAESQENASRNALKILSEMGLNNVKGS